MADRTRRGRQALNLGLQAASLKRWYPHGETVLRGRLLTWKGTLTPSELSATYEILVVLEDGSDPLVYVVDPPFCYWDDEPLPHVFPHQTLCLFLGEEWGPWAPLANSILPWTAEWLLFYEGWLATGEWTGGGVHPAPPPQGSHRGRPKRKRAAPDRRLGRLKAGLRQAYGPKVDIDHLLANSRR